MIQVFLDSGDFIHMEELPPLPEKPAKILKNRLIKIKKACEIYKKTQKKDFLFMKGLLRKTQTKAFLQPMMMHMEAHY